MRNPNELLSTFGDVHNTDMEPNIEFGAEEAGVGVCYHISQYMLYAKFKPGAGGHDTAEGTHYIPAPPMAGGGSTHREIPGTWSGEIKIRDCCMCSKSFTGVDETPAFPPNTPKQDSGPVMENCRVPGGFGAGHHSQAGNPFSMGGEGWWPGAVCTRTITRSVTKRLCSPCRTRKCRCRNTTVHTTEAGYRVSGCEWATIKIVGGNGLIGGTPSLSEADIEKMCPDAGDRNWPSGPPPCSSTEEERYPGTAYPPPPPPGSAYPL